MNLILFTVSVFVLSSAIAYAWWVKIRVWILRQELFEIRDATWYKLRDRDPQLLNHPAHREFRQGMNAIIEFAPRISMTFFKFNQKHPPAQHRKIPGGLPEVDLAIKATESIVVRYLIFHTLTGFLHFALFCWRRKGASSQYNPARDMVQSEALRGINWEKPSRSGMAIA